MVILVLKLSNPAQFHPWSDVDATVACLVITQSARDCEFSFLCSLTVRKKNGLLCKLIIAQSARVFNTNDFCDMHWILKLYGALL